MKENGIVSSSLGIKYPIIMAPMFLVSNQAMVQKAMTNGIMGTFPTLNFREKGQLDSVLETLNRDKSCGTSGNYGVNLIVQKSNPLFDKQYKTCVDHRVPFYITSLGNPARIMDGARSYGAKVYADIVSMEHAEKCAKIGVDGFIAVGAGAGGHAGPHPLNILLPSLKKHFPHMPLIAAGGIGEGANILGMFAFGADGVSIGTRFIASTEADVNQDYKNAIIHSDQDDIVMTTRLSGTPCNVLNTPYVQKIGLDQNFLERFFSKNATTKKYFKMLIQLKGTKMLEEAIKPGNYNNIWTAGKSVEFIKDIKPTEQIIKDLINEYEKAKSDFFANI